MTWKTLRRIVAANPALAPIVMVKIGSTVIASMIREARRKVRH